MDINRMSGAAKEAVGKTEAKLGQIARDAKTEASGSAREAEGTIQNAFGQATDAVKDFTGSAVEAGRSMYRDGGDAIYANVRSSPGSALLMAGLFGFTLGVIIAKGSQPSRPRRPWDRYYR